MISTDRIAVRPVRTVNRRLLVGGVLALVLAVGIVAGLAGRMAATAPATTAGSATVWDLAAFSPTIIGDASLLDSVTSVSLPSGYSDWLGGDQSRETSLTGLGTTAVSSTVRDLATFSPSIIGDASLLDAATSAPLPSGYSDWLGGDQSRETRLTAPGTTAVSSIVSDLATFSPSILGDASLVDAAPSTRLPTGYSDWLGGDQSREAPVTP